jgi:hypothetical protein
MEFLQNKAQLIFGKHLMIQMIHIILLKYNQKLVINNQIIMVLKMQELDLILIKMEMLLTFTELNKVNLNKYTDNPQ